jgi:hypothetical protein
VASASGEDGSGCASNVARRQTRLARTEGLAEFWRPGDGMRTLDFGAGENFMEWCLGSSSVGHKSPIKVEHAQETT